MGWVDIVIISILVISAIIGLAKGLFESILSLFGTGLSIVVSIYAAKPVASFLSGFVDVNGFAGNLLEQWGIAENGVVTIIGLNFSLAQAAEFVTIVASAIVVFILIKLVIWLLAKLFDSATANSSVLSGLNRVLGLVFGAVKGAVTVAILLAVASVVSRIGFFSTEIIDTINNTTLAKFAYGYVDQYVQETLEDQLQNLIGNGQQQNNDEEETPENPPVEDGENVEDGE